jgi:hypothetical protein
LLKIKSLEGKLKKAAKQLLETEARETAEGVAVKA